MKSSSIAYVILPIIVVSTVLGIYFGSAYIGGTHVPQETQSTASAVSTSSTTVFSGNMEENSSINHGIKLYASVNTATNSDGRELLNVTFLVQNTLSTANNVTKASNWALPQFLNGTDTQYQCVGWGNMLVFTGFYSLHNISTVDSALPLFQPGVGENCTYYDFALYSFLPASPEAKVYGGGDGSPMSLYGTQQLLLKGTLSGYYAANQSYTTLNKMVAPLPFAPGAYTIAIGDQWGQLALLYFTVQNPQLTTMQSNATTWESASLGSNSFYTTTSAYQSAFLAESQTFGYDGLPSASFRVGNFTILKVNNSTGYSGPVGTSTTVTITPFVFAFNITTPDLQTTSHLFTWWSPPCSLHLDGSCNHDNSSWTLPTPENTTINFRAANLLIFWYSNSTGLYVSFQEWDQATVVTTITMLGQATTSSIMQAATAINASNACVAYFSFANNGSNTESSFYKLISSIESYPKFQELEGNRSGYQYGGGGCGTSGLLLTFDYTDNLHPFKSPCGGDAFPSYQIYVSVYLTSEGYDLSRSNYTSIYHGPTNSTFSCTTFVTVSG